MSELRGLKYYGGKSRTLGKWVADLTARTETYAEPFSGMLGVLLARQPVRHEIINDIDKRITNWWTVVRDKPGELAERLTNTPYCETTFLSLRETDWDSQDDVWRAWALTVLVGQSFNSMQEMGARFSKSFASLSAGSFGEDNARLVMNLRERIANVVIYNMDAVEFCERLAGNKDSMVYCDPPYHSARDEYERNDLDVDAFKDVLARMKGKVLVSGYPGEYDDLGWDHMDYERTATTSPGKPVKRTERVWANYKLVYQKLF